MPRALTATRTFSESVLIVQLRRVDSFAALFQDRLDDLTVRTSHESRLGLAEVYEERAI